MRERGVSGGVVGVLLYVHRNRRLIRDGEKVGEGGVEQGGEGDYLSIATLSPPE